MLTFSAVINMTKLTRRQFIVRSGAQTASLGLVLNGKLITFNPSLLPEPAGPNDRVNLGFIGFGIRGNILLEAAKETQQANLVEVCDCYQGHLERAKERTEGKIETNFAQYKRLLDRKDIDAVVVATPDHWHKRIVLDALSAGKDVYIEKPMTHRIEDGPVSRRRRNTSASCKSGANGYRRSKTRRRVKSCNPANSGKSPR